MTSYLADTDVIIDHLGGRADVDRLVSVEAAGTWNRLIRLHEPLMLYYVMKRIAQRQTKETAMRPAARKTAAQTAVEKAKVMSPHQRREFWRSQGIDPKKVKTHTDGIRGPIQLKVYDNEHGKIQAR